MKLRYRPALHTTLRKVGGPHLGRETHPWLAFISLYACTLILMAFVMVATVSGMAGSYIAPMLMTLLLIGPGTLLVWVAFYSGRRVLVRLPLPERILYMFVLSGLTFLELKYEAGWAALLPLPSAVYLNWRSSHYDHRARRYAFFMYARKFLREHPQYVDRQASPDRKAPRKARQGLLGKRAQGLNIALVQKYPPTVYQRGEGVSFLSQLVSGTGSLLLTVAGVFVITSLLLAEPKPLLDDKVVVQEQMITIEPVWNEGEYTDPAAAVLARMDQKFTALFNLKLTPAHKNYRFEYVLLNPDGKEVRRNNLKVKPAQQSWAVTWWYRLGEKEYAAGTWTVLLRYQDKVIGQAQVMLVY